MPETDGALNTATSPAADGAFAGDVQGIGNRAEYIQASDGASGSTLSANGASNSRFGVNFGNLLDDGEQPVEQATVETPIELVEKPVEQQAAMEETPAADDTPPVEEETADERFDKHPRFQELLAESKAAKAEAAAARAEIAKFNQWQQQQQEIGRKNAEEAEVARFAQERRDQLAFEAGLDPDSPDPVIQSLIEGRVAAEAQNVRNRFTEQRAKEAQEQLAAQQATHEAVQTMQREFPTVAPIAFDVDVEGIGNVNGSLTDFATMFTAYAEPKDRATAMRTFMKIAHQIDTRARQDERTQYQIKLTQNKTTAGPTVTKAGGNAPVTPKDAPAQARQPVSKFFSAPLNLD